MSAALVKELRERTGLGLLECKRALAAAGGDVELAIEEMRKSSGMKAAKKAGRTAADGVVVTRIAEDGSYGIAVEVNSETDFVARDENFLGFVSNVSSRKWLHSVIGSFRKNCPFPSQGGAILAAVPGIGWSDHWSFWKAGYPAVMVTDTAPFRYPYYHSPQDTPDKIDYDRLARITSGLEKVIYELTNQ